MVISSSSHWSYVVARNSCTSLAAKKAADKSKGSLAVFRVALESQGPGIELLAGGLAQEGTDVGQRHTRLAQRIDDPRIGHLTLRVVPVP